MEQKVTYTQEQLNVACKSYADEAKRLMDIKGSLMMDNFNLRQKIAELTKQNAELRKQKEVVVEKVDVNKIQNIP